MKTGAVVTNRKTHRTYSKSAFAPMSFLQANTKRTGDKPPAVCVPVARFVSNPCNKQRQPCNLKTDNCAMIKPRCRLRVVGARRQRFELLSLPFQASCAMKTGVEVTNGQNHRTYRKSAIEPTMLLQANVVRTGGKPLAV
jgi:hypothetical protein